MSSKSELPRAPALALLSLAAFLLGPALGTCAPEGIPSELLLAVLPAVLLLTTLVVVAVVSYCRTGSTARTLTFTALSFVVGVVGAIARPARWPMEPSPARLTRIPRCTPPQWKSYGCGT
jgi:hypothetical protein